MNLKNRLSSLLSLRKINSLVLLVIILLLLNHAISSLLYLSGITAYSPNLKVTGRRLFLWLLLHITISLYLYIRDWYNQKGFNRYNHIRSETKRQMISGIAIIIFVILHLVTYHASPVSVVIYQINIVHFIVDTLLFASILVHLQVSIPRLLMSFGFLKEENSYQRASQIT
ncbi:MAG: hypothetical protein BZ136_01230, partial [Methanosphaera sp. rholeuAM74]